LACRGLRSTYRALEALDQVARAVLPSRQPARRRGRHLPPCARGDAVGRIAPSATRADYSARVLPSRHSWCSRPASTPIWPRGPGDHPS
jgi:hypothetical protein